MSADTQFQGVATEIENTNNKVTSISSASTDTQYASAKSVYDYVASQNPEHGTWAPVFETSMFTSDTIIDGRYTILNDKECYVYLHIDGRFATEPSSFEYFSGLPIALTENAPFGLVSGLDMANNKFFSIGFSPESSGGGVVFSASANDSINWFVSGIYTYA